MPSLLAGNCTFFIWDSQRASLYCVRDRAGSSGIYFAHRGPELLISNRIEPILRLLTSPLRPNLGAIVAHVNGLAPSPSETFYESVASVDAGGMLTWSRGQLKNGRYWVLSPQPVLALKSDDEYASAYREKLLQVVSGYSTGQPAAISVSGGLDSTSVVAALKTVSPQADLMAVTWTAPEINEADETEPAGAVCRHLSLESREVRADIHYPMSSQEGITTAIKSPFLNYYHDTWEATFALIRSSGRTVLFTGHSGDSLFGGFVTPYSDLLLCGRMLDLIDQVRRHNTNSQVGIASILLRMTLRPIVGAYLPLSFRERLRKPAPWLRTEHRATFLEAVARNLAPVRRLLPGRSRRLALLSHPLAPHIEELQTSHAAEFGIDWRSPLEDHRLIEFAASLPAEQTFSAGVDKMIVRRGQRGFLPDEVLNAEAKIFPTKILRRGFETRRSELNKLMTGMRAAELGIVDEAKVRESVQAYFDGRNASELFWYVLTLEDWLRRYF